jgi:hypothetical protein
LDKTGGALFRGVEGADGDEVFEEFSLFGEAFTLEGGSGLAFSEGAAEGLPRESGFLGLWP